MLEKNKQVYLFKRDENNKVIPDGTGILIERIPCSIQNREFQKWKVKVNDKIEERYVSINHIIGEHVPVKKLLSLMQYDKKYLLEYIQNGASKELEFLITRVIDKLNHLIKFIERKY